MAAVCTRLTIQANFFRYILHRLTEQMSEHIGAHLTGSNEGVRGSCGCDPERQAVLDRSWKQAYFNFFSTAADDLDRLSSPQFEERLDGLECDLSALLIALRGKHKIICVPA